MVDEVCCLLRVQHICQCHNTHLELGKLSAVHRPQIVYSVDFQIISFTLTMAATKISTRASTDARDPPVLTLVRESDLDSSENFLYSLVPLSRTPQGWMNEQHVFAIAFRACCQRILDSTWTNGYRFTRIVPVIAAMTAAVFIFEEKPGTYFCTGCESVLIWRIVSPASIEELLDSPPSIIEVQDERPLVTTNMGLKMERMEVVHPHGQA